MRYADASAFRMALEQRLKDAAGDDGARLARDRKRVAFDRLLARLTAWAVPYRELAQATGVPTDLAAGHAAAAALLDPILTAHITAGTWDPNEQRWTTPPPAVVGVGGA